MKRSASARWEGSLKDGQGKISSESGTLSHTSYSFKKRFGDEIGTNPEELVAAAHSACYAMALSGELTQKQLTPESLDVKATVNLQKEGSGWSIAGIHLSVEARVPGADEESFQQAAQSAKVNCPISKLMKTEISLESHLLDSQQEQASSY